MPSTLAPLGLPSLTPSENDKVNSANRALEVVLWCAEQALFCKSKAVGLNIIFPEDLGGHQSEGPSSLWVLREIQLLEGIHDARRAAGYLCQFTRTDYKRPLGLFSTSRKLRARLSLGWPRLERIHDRLVYKGPLPKNCACNHIHTPMIGTSADDVFCTSDTLTFSSDFWKHFVSDRPLDSELSSLRDEGLQTDFAPLHSVGLSPLLSPSLASGVASLRYVRSMESWKPLQSHSTGHIQYRVLQYLFLYTAFVFPSYVSEIASGLSLEGLLGFPPSSSTSSFRLRRARSRSPTSLKTPLVRLRPRGDVSSMVTDWRSPLVR